MAIAAASAGTPVSLGSTGSDGAMGRGTGSNGGMQGGGKEDVDWKGSDELAMYPPLWQEHKSLPKAVVTEADLKTFQHFWLANAEKKILVTAIPKVR